MLKEHLLLNEYGGHFESSEIEPSHELVHFLCEQSSEIFNGYTMASEQCECGGSMNVYQAIEEVPTDKFKELNSIEAIELYSCTSCEKWKLDFIG
ncbi:hypothetical protein ORM34_20330 [Bacillus cereus]|uniref:hypothetical protein n=1 Tax=Bacillus cereus TaxID=1396 RepID=UPI002AC1A24E|nr:hypothetical protein [Bacillus cereus]MDZ4453230.1 hypothetical protein [Bacillus cereus]